MNLAHRFNPNLKSIQAFALKAQKAKVKLNQNENPFDLPLEIKEKVLQKFLNEQWNRYPSPAPFELIKKLSEHHGVDSDRIVICNGSNELIYAIFLALNLKDAPVLIPQPSFYLYGKITKILGGRIIEVFLNDDFSFNVDSIAHAIVDNKPGVVGLCSPNNPGGKSLKFDDVKFLISLSDAIFIIDEAYFEFSSERSAVELLDEFSNLIVIRTMSKAFGLAGIRIVYALTSKEIADEIKKVRLPFTIDRFAELTAIEILNHLDLVKRNVNYIIEQKEWLYNELCKIDEIKVFNTETNFLLVKVDGGEVVDMLLEEGVAVRDMSSYPMMDKIFRVTVGTFEENRYFLNALKKVLTKVKAS